MAKAKKIEIGALNIVMHPHAPLRYVELLRDVRRRQLIAPAHGVRQGTIANVAQMKFQGGTAYTGDVYTFTHVNVDADWFNVQTHGTADDEDLSEVTLPSHLKPDSARFSYLFLPEIHTLFFEVYYDSNHLSPTTCARLLNGLFNHPKLGSKYGRVDVTPWPSEDELSKALKMPRLDRLDLTITRPNPDTLTQAEKEMYERMDAQNVDEIQESLKAVKGKSIEPSEETEIKARIAARNGTVHAKGADSEGHPIEYQTSAHPWITKFYYDPKVESAFEMFAEKVAQVKDTWVQWFNR